MAEEFLRHYAVEPTVVFLKDDSRFSKVLGDARRTLLIAVSTGDVRSARDYLMEAAEIMELTRIGYEFEPDPAFVSEYYPGW